jgi:phenylacetate-coenzyme A ligase PaaK-like adenylate-forming protein
MNEVFQRYLGVLGKTEFMPRAMLEEYQRGLVRRLVSHARINSPFYASRLDRLIAPDGSIDLQRWSEVPILTRTEVTESFDRMRAANLDQSSLGPVSEHKTSGSGGEPIMFGVNGLAKLANNAALTRLALWHGADPAKPLAQLRIYRMDPVPRYPEGQVSRGWSQAGPDAEQYGLDMRATVDEQIEWLSRHKAPYLMTLPSNAMALAYAMADAAAPMTFEKIFSISETVIPGARELVAEKLGARLIAIYSTEEVGYIATECPVTPHYHVCSEMTLIEIVDDAGLPVPAGETGRVLVTSLYNYATPFIRYDVGDVAIADDRPCSCGRTLPVLSQVLGRTRNAFVFRDGKRAWPRVWNATAMRAFIPCREFQVVQVDHERIEFRYVSDGEQPIDAEGLRAYAKQHLHPSVEAVPVRVDRLLRGPGGKLDPFVSNLS